MNWRERKARDILKSRHIQYIGHKQYRVEGRDATQYIVDIAQRVCTCRAFRLGSTDCKHLEAIDLFLREESSAEIDVLALPISRPTYKQNWPVYNAAQCFGPLLVPHLARDLVASVFCDDGETGAVQLGRTPLSTADSILCIISRAFTCGGGRQATSSIVRMIEDDLMTLRSAPHSTTVDKKMRDQGVVDKLNKLVEESARPLRHVETCFAVDATGFSAPLSRYFIELRGSKEIVQKRAEWITVHVAIGVRTKICTAVTIKDQYAADSPQLIPLLQKCNRLFKVDEVYADKAYTGADNIAFVRSIGGKPYFPFKRGARLTGKVMWDEEYVEFHEQNATWMARYHLRSNVESFFSSIKRVMSDRVNGRTFGYQASEVLGMILHHNLRTLVEQYLEGGIRDIPFACDRTRQLMAEIKENISRKDDAA